MNLFNEIKNLRKGSIKAALCIIVKTKGSTPRKVGAKMIVKSNGEVIGSIGGGSLEKKTIENAILQIEKKEPNIFKHDLLHQHNMCCGGSVEIYIEPINKMNTLYIFGAGHTGKALANIASELDFEVFIIDDRKEYIDEITNNKVNKLCANHQNILKSLPFNNSTYISIMTYDHAIDRDILSYCLKQEYAYLGMIGSKRKVELTKKMFLESKIATEEQLNKIDMPMGIDISAEEPIEIAISIISKLIAIKNG